MNVIFICLAAIVLVIAIGAKTKTNIGLWAIGAAYLIGVFILKLKPADIITAFPTKIFLMLFSVTLFYGFAILNGALEKLAQKVVYFARNIPWSIPIVLFLLSFLMAAIGAGDGATVMMIPIGLSIAKVTGMSNYLAAVSCVAGISMGGFSPISTAGIFLRDMAERVGKHGPDVVDVFGNHAFFQVSALYTFVFIVAYIVFKGYKLSVPSLEKPGAFDKKQKVNLVIIGLFVLVMVLVPVLKTLMPKAPTIKMLSAGLNLTFVAFIASVFAVVFKVGDEKKAFQRVPLASLFTLTGMGTLIGIVSKSGAIEMVSKYLSGSVPPGLVGVMMALIAGIMSLFVSGFVVNTTFFALVPALALGSGFNPGFLYAAVAVGAMATAVSPFSGSGGLVVASVDDEEHRKKIFNFLLVWPFVNLTIYLLMVAVGVY
jgi:di/tricarboxylate transporter